MNREKLEAFMQAVGHRATTPGVVYFTGGATALLLGIREQTVDVDIKLDPEPGGVFQAIADLKNSLGINVELAAPDDFLPPLPGWKERSPFVETAGKVAFRHYDLYAQVLAKIERGHKQDVQDARAMVNRAGLDPDELVRLAAAIEPDMIRYPAVDVSEFERNLSAFVAALAEQSAE